MWGHSRHMLRVQLHRVAEDFAVSAPRVRVTYATKLHFSVGLFTPPPQTARAKPGNTLFCSHMCVCNKGVFQHTGDNWGCHAVF